MKFLLIKLLNWNVFCFLLDEHFSPNVVTEFNKGSNVDLGKMVYVYNGCKIKVRHGGKLKIGSNANLNYNCIIACHDSVEIGANTVILRGAEIGDNCVIGTGSVVSGKYGANSVIIQERNTNMKKIFGREYRRLVDVSLLRYLTTASDWRCVA